MITDETVEAVASRITPGVSIGLEWDELGDVLQDYWRRRVRSALEAAEPLIRQQVAEGIARAIEEASANIYYGDRHALHEAVEVAREFSKGDSA